MSAQSAGVGAPAIVILGAGGHAAVVAESAQAAGHALHAIAARERPEAIAPLGALPWLGDPDDPAVAARLDALVAAGVRLHAAVGDAGLRMRWFARFGAHAFATVVDRSAIVSPSAAIGAGAFIAPRATVNARATLADGAIVNTGATIEHDCALGACSHVAPAAVLCGGVRVGQGSLVGAGAVVVPGIAVGANATIGAGSVVVRDVEASSTAVGVPARPR
ncbi:MAG: NeuD/PglB/VioB family sugar acetyltransferase [Planctomycetota bacterium]